MKQISDLKDEINQWEKLNNNIQELLELSQTGEESLRPDLENESIASASKLTALSYQHFYQNPTIKETLCFQLIPCGRHGRTGLGRNASRMYLMG